MTAADTTDIMGQSHPVLTQPTTRVYQTPYPNGPVVTFHHNDHIELFGLRCVDCHRQENCGRCHDLQMPARMVKTQEEVHATCDNCHAKDRCAKCHDTKERAAFTHAATGWPLNRYHRELDCRSCHPTGRRISRLGTGCAACHKGWNQDNFKHAITALMLDDTHAQIDCTECHIDRRFDAPVQCATCHDDGRNAKDAPPGKYLSSRP